jgi:hypothetical protein
LPTGHTRRAPLVRSKISKVALKRRHWCIVHGNVNLCLVYLYRYSEYHRMQSLDLSLRSSVRAFVNMDPVFDTYRLLLFNYFYSSADKRSEVRPATEAQVWRDLIIHLQDVMETIAITLCR